MSEMTPKESAALRARIVAGADGLEPHRGGAARMVAIATSVAVVAVVSIGAVALSLGLGSTDDTLATPSPTPSISTTPTRTSTPTPTATPSDTPTPAPTQEPTTPPAALENGQDLVTPVDWDLLYTQGWGYYMMSNERYVATDPTQDLPGEVATDIQRRIDAIPNNTMAENDRATSLMATSNLLADVRTTTGKDLVILRYNPFSVPGEPNDSAIRWYATASQQGWWMPLSKNRDQLLADVNAWIAANTAPGSWAVFVGPGEPIIP